MFGEVAAAPAPQLQGEVPPGCCLEYSGRGCCGLCCRLIIRRARHSIRAPADRVTPNRLKFACRDLMIIPLNHENNLDLCLSHLPRKLMGYLHRSGIVPMINVSVSMPLRDDTTSGVRGHPQVLRGTFATAASLTNNSKSQIPYLTVTTQEGVRWHERFFRSDQIVGTHH